MAKGYSLDLRRRVWRAWQNGEGTQRQLAVRFAVSVSFVRDLSRRFRESGDVAAKPYGGGRAPSVNAATSAAIRARADAYSDHSIEEHRQGLAEAGHRLSHSARGRTLLQLGLTRKKNARRRCARYRAREGATPGVCRADCRGAGSRPGLCGRERGQPGDDAPPRAQSAGHARLWLGPTQPGRQREHPRRADLAGPPCLPCASTGPPTGRCSWPVSSGFLVPALWPGAVVVMDNLGAHKVKGVRERIEGAGARLLYLSPYSPDFHPIEMAWSKLKAYLRKVAARPTETLDGAIAAGWQAVSAADADGYFAHCGYC